MTVRTDIERFYEDQLRCWPQADDNVRALDNVRVKELTLDGMTVRVQHNPARIVSTGAKVDAAAIAARSCFLCADNRPAEQKSLPFGDYEILVNPFPIFRGHLTIAARAHTPQAITGRLADIIEMSLALPGYTVFYNGPRCGASAPDHLHAQACPTKCLPIWSAVEATTNRQILKHNGATLYLCAELPVPCFLITADSSEEADILFNNVMRCLPAAVPEPMLNLLCKTEEDLISIIIIPRKAHRPNCYGSADGQMLISPASVDLGGVVVTPRAIDFEAIDAVGWQSILRKVCLSRDEITVIADAIAPSEEPKVKVGILSAKELKINLLHPYTISENGASIQGALKLCAGEDGTVQLAGESYSTLHLVPSSANASFYVHDVTIGVNFHWQRNERQRFAGEIEVINLGGKLTLINIVPVETYLRSVISSEMSATASAEFLKAHAVISRSWLLAQIAGRETAAKKYNACTLTKDELVRWYDRDDHTLFDVCADDHCQRYQGITRQTTATVAEAIAETFGLVLTDRDGKLCDARFSKCCGGVFEEFENCWEPVHHHYLEARADSSHPDVYPDLREDGEARRWIMSSPIESFCNTADARILGQVLNDYDRETTDFYRWSVTYAADELADLIARRSGLDFGRIIALEPLQRGTSGRIVRLRIRGTLHTMVIGKELEIRRTLSETHLRSSAFVVDYGPADTNGLPSSFTLHGAGWGHGVGLCQIGAAVMGDRGYSFRQILAHYFPGSTLTQLYKSSNPKSAEL